MKGFISDTDMTPKQKALLEKLKDYVNPAPILSASLEPHILATLQSIEFLLASIDATLFERRELDGYAKNYHPAYERTQRHLQMMREFMRSDGDGNSEPEASPDESQPTQ